MLPKNDTGAGRALKIFIGYDERECVAWHVAAQSIMDTARKPVLISPLNLSNLPMYKRPYGKQSTAFTYSRFLVPYLCNYEGFAVFMDCDMILLDDIWKLMDEIEPGKAVWCVQHKYTPATKTKFLANPQVQYPRKNWSSVIVFDNSKCRALTPDVVNTAEPSFLHQFKWLQDNEIGKLGKEWNHLVGEYKPNPKAKLVHYTLGTPCFPEYQNQEFAREWFERYWKVKG